jgi:hypothetical protein
MKCYRQKYYSRLRPKQDFTMQSNQSLSAPVSLRLPHDLIARLHELAKRDQRTFSAYLRLQLERIASDARKEKK